MKILDVPRSGSYAGLTSSRNRFGQYVRTRAVPVNPNTTNQAAARVILSGLAGNWRNLSQAQRDGWATLGGSMTRTDSLGQSYSLTGLQAYISINSLRQAVGDATVDDAPSIITPADVLTLTLTLDATPTMSLAFTATPLGAAERLLVYASPAMSQGKSWNGDYRLIYKSAAALASPANLLASWQSRFGAFNAGDRIFLSVALYTEGVTSTPLKISGIVGP